MLTGGSDALSDVLIGGFNSLESLSPKPAQPYSKNRSGLSLGEGSGMLVLVREDLARKLGLPAGSTPLDLVFHGGSGSQLAEIHQALSYGVIKMNVDTDTQYAFTRPIAAHMFTHYDGVLKIDGEVGNKKVYDPRSYLKVAEQSMATRVVQACEDLRSTGRTLAG